MKYMKIGQLQWFAFWLMLVNYDNTSYVTLWIFTLFFNINRTSRNIWKGQMMTERDVYQDGLQLFTIKKYKPKFRLIKQVFEDLNISPKDAMLWFLCDKIEFSQDEVSRNLNIPQTTISYRVRKTRERLLLLKLD